MDRIVLATVSLFCLTSLAWGRPKLSDGQLADVIDQFQYQGNYEITSTDKGGGFLSSCWTYDQVFETEYPQADEAMEVEMKLYIPNRSRLGDEQVPAVIILPPTGGMNYLDRQTAETLCDYNMAAIILKTDFSNIVAQAEGDLLPPEDHEQAFYRVAAGIKAVMAMVAEDENMDSSKVGLFGVSLGGILGSFVMSTQPNISAGYFVVAGGDIPEILAYSEQREVSAIRRKRMREQGFETKEEFENFLREHIPFDPMDMAPMMLPETLRMVIANRDDVVATENQRALQEAFGNPQTMYYESGHTQTVISFLLPFTGRRRVARFFEERFEVENPRPDVFEAFNPYLELAAD
jgi:hypothetical protein